MRLFLFLLLFIFPVQGWGQSVPSVGVTFVEKAEFSTDLKALGTVRALESVVISSEVSGVISEIGFEEGTSVQQGSVLFRLKADEIAAQLQAARIQLQSTRAELARAEELRASRTLPVAVYEERQTAVRRAEADVQTWEARLNQHEIRAPFSGTLGLRRVSVGAFVQPAQPLVTLDSLDRLKVEFPIPSDVLSAFAVGQTLQANLNTIERVQGVIEAIDTRVDDVTRTVLLTARLEALPLLRPGMLLTLSFKTDVASRVSVPEDALLQRGEAFFVFRVEADADGEVKVFETPVMVGRRQNGRVEVSGLEEGQRIVHQGVFKVRDGQSVRLVQP